MAATAVRVLPWVRRFVIRQAWCVLSRHRIQKVCFQTRMHTHSDGCRWCSASTAAQAAVDAWRQEYNTTRPHQAIGMASPAERFTSAKDSKAEQLLPLRLPAILSPLPPAEGSQDRAARGFTHLAWPGALQGAASGDHGAGQAAPDHQAKFGGALPPRPSQDTGQTPALHSAAETLRAYDGGPVEFERAVPPSGNMEVTGRQFWLGPAAPGRSSRSGPTPT
jgi:hypothetical protein